METQKIANLLGNTDNESFAKENSQREKGVLLMIKIIQTMVMEMKMVQPLNLKLESLNQIFMIIQTHILL